MKTTNKNKNDRVVNSTSRDVSIKDFVNGAYDGKLFSILTVVLTNLGCRCNGPLDRLAREMIRFLKTCLEGLMVHCRLSGIAARGFGVKLFRVLGGGSKSIKNLNEAMHVMNSQDGIERFTAMHDDQGRDPADVQMLPLAVTILDYQILGRMRLMPVLPATLQVLQALPPLTTSRGTHLVWWEAAEQLVLADYGYSWSALPGKAVQNIMHYRTLNSVQPDVIHAYAEMRVREKLRAEYLSLCADYTHDPLLAHACAWQP